MNSRFGRSFANSDEFITSNRIKRTLLKMDFIMDFLVLMPGVRAVTGPIC